MVDHLRICGVLCRGKTFQARTAAGEVRARPVAPADKTPVIIVHNVEGSPCAKWPGLEDRNGSPTDHDHRVGRKTLFYQPPTQGRDGGFPGMGVADAFTGGGKATALIIRHDVDDQHDDGSLQLSHADDLLAK